MRRLILFGIMCGWMVLKASAVTLIATQVTVQDMTVDKDNFFVTVLAHTSTGEFEVAFDIYPATHSAIGSFSAADKTISYVSSFVHQTKANGSTVNMWYYPEEDAAISVSISKKDDATCTLSGSITASRNGSTSTYSIAAFDFAYSEGEVDPGQEPDPYRFEPTETTTINFSADVINFREREGYIEVTLNEMANETYDWIELALVSEELAMPAGTYTIDASGAAGSLTASKGYLGSTKGDDPCYVAIRADKEYWGQYTPYYLTSGSLTVNYNEKGDTISITGSVLSHNGSTITISAHGYNMLYEVEEQPKEPEFVTLAIDTVLITYLREESDNSVQQNLYTFNLFSTQGDYPNVLVDVILPDSAALTEGTYTLAAGQLSGLLLFQNQSDFNSFFYGGEPYTFVTASLTLSQGAGDVWTYTMHIIDAIGSEYDFSFSQAAHIVNYPEPEVDPKEQPYTDEQKETAVITVTLDTLIWDDKTVSKDGVLDIYLTQKEVDVQGLRAYIHLGMYTPVSYPAANTYPVNGSEDDYTFSASLGRYGTTVIPCYLTLMDEESYAHAVWYIVSGNITLSYENEQPVLSGECTSYFGSTIRFEYKPSTQGMESIQHSEIRIQKVLRDGQIYLMYEGRMYDVRGNKISNL